MSEEQQLAEDVGSAGGRSPLTADLIDRSQPVIDRWFIQSAAKCLLKVSNNNSNKPSVDSQVTLQ